MNISAQFKKLFGIVGIAAFSLLMVLSTQNSVFAGYVFSRKISTTVEVNSADQVKVTQVHSLSWNNPSYYFPASKNYIYAYIYPAFTSQSADLEKSIGDIKVSSRFSGKTNIAYTKTVVDGAVQLRIPYYQNLSSDSSIEVTVTYNTSLYAVKQGGILDFSYPGLSKEFIAVENHPKDNYEDRTSYSLTVKIAKSLGEISSVNPSPDSQSDKNATYKEFTYQGSSLVGKSAKITVGTERTIRFVLSGKTYPTSTNSSQLVKGLLVNYIDVALPTQQSGTEFANQSVYYSKIEPFPTSITNDGDGNLIARIPVSATSEGTISIEGYAKLRNIPVSESGKNAVTAELTGDFNKFLGNEDRYWQVDNSKIKEIALKNTDSSGLTYQSVRKTLSYVSQTLSYKKVTNESELRRLGAVQSLTEKVGVCMEYSDLTLSLLRAQKIPTRAVFGDGVGARVDRTLAGIGHQWVGVWIPSDGWVPVDPTWSEAGSEYIGHDFDHFVWYVASKSVDEPNGFNCLSWDTQSPCKEALTIETTPVENVSRDIQLTSVLELKQKVLEQNAKDKQDPNKNLQSFVNIIGSSYFGRVVLSKQGVLIVFALVMYLVLVLIVNIAMKLIRKAKKNPVTPS